MDKDIEYLQNPAAGLKHPADIQACLIFEFPRSAPFYVGNSRPFIDNENIILVNDYTVRTDYFPISCLVDKTFFLIGQNQQLLHFPNVHIKILANFEVDTDADPDAKELNSMFVAKYPVNLRSQNPIEEGSDFTRLAFNPADPNLEFIPTRDELILSNTTINSDITRVKRIVIKNGVNFGSNPITIRAIQEIIVEPSVNIPPNVTLEVVRISKYLSTHTPKCGRTVSSVDESKINKFCTTEYTKQPRIKSGNTVASNSDESSAEGGEENTEEESKTILSPAYPNPTSNGTTIPYTLAKSSKVYLYLSDAKGTKLLDLVNGQIQEEGDYEVVLDTKDLKTGVYFYTLQTDDYKETKRLIVLD